jgi:uridine monophosphate synthetase
MNAGSAAGSQLRELVCHLYDVGAVKFGQFTLKSGTKSPVYFDLRVMVSYPKLMRSVSELLWSMVAEQRSEFSSLCGVPYTALPLATLISTAQDIPMLIRRKEVKTYGTKRAIEGTIVPGAKCLIVEDVISSGGSVLETVAALQREGLEVRVAVILLDREQGGVKKLRDWGITAVSGFTMTEMMDVLFEAGKVTSSEVKEVQNYLFTSANDPTPLSLPSSLAPSPKPRLSYSDRVSSATHPLAAHLLSLMDDKKTNLALSADVHTSKELLMLADLVGPHICLLKTHVDIMTDFTADTASRLKQLATQHNFVIMEDRKFADIGNTVQLQYSSPALHLSSGWAGLVTSHALPGPGVIDGLKGVATAGSGCVLVVEMSSQDSLTSPEYTTAAVSMAIAHPDYIVGVVSRHRPKSLPLGMLVMTPGVKLVHGVDPLGQNYITPEKAIQQLGSDIIIVGRGIYTASNVVATAKEFQERAYSAYLSIHET